MAKFKDFKSLFKSINKKVDELTNKSGMDEVGEEAVDMVKKRTRLGYGADGRKKEKLGKLSEGYQKQRKKKKLSKSTSPSKSNLTNTGKMLDDLTHTSQDESTTIEFNTQESLKKAEWVTKGGRPFMSLTAQEKKRITKFLQEKADTLGKKR